MKRLIEKLLMKKEVGKLKKLSNNNKGFSLIELLIVIAIMGVLAVIAFNMFGGVLTNSKKRADDQQARNLEKAILTYCVDSGDWSLAEGKVSGAAIDLTDSNNLIKALLSEITGTDDKTYGPILSPRYPEESATSDNNIAAYMPQWRKDKGGEYEGWQIDIYGGTKQSVTVKPVKDKDLCKVTYHAG